jgi:hypothetical protein
MKNAFIDTGVLDNTSINIPEDTVITLKFGVYEYNYDTTSKYPPYIATGDPWPVTALIADGKMKVLRRIVTSTQFDRQIVAFSKSNDADGDYASHSPFFSVITNRPPTVPAPLIVKVQYAVIDANFGDKTKLIATWSADPTQTNVTYTAGALEEQNIFTGSFILQNGVGYGGAQYQTYTIDNMGRNTTPGVFKGDLVWSETPFPVLTGPYIAGDIVELTESITIKKGRYPPDALAKLITDGFNSRINSNPYGLDCGPGKNLLVNLRTLANSGMADFKDKDGKPTSTYNGCWSFLLSDPDTGLKNTGVDGYFYGLSYDATVNGVNTGLGWASPDIVIGASQFGMSYQPGGYFQLDYMHTPFFDPTTKNISIYDFVSVDYSGSSQGSLGPGGGDPTAPKVNNIVLGKASGIFLTDVQPRPFWSDTLGFNLDDLLVKINRPSDLNPEFITVSSAEIERKTPGGYQSLQSVMAAGKRLITPSTAAANGQYTEVTGTRPIIGGVQTVNTTGYYLVELTGAHNSDYVSPRGTFSQIIGVVSTQWNNGDFVTAYEDSAIPYVHRGMPLTISKCTVRILDRITKLPVQTLGKGTSIILEVMNQIQSSIPPVPQPKKKNRRNKKKSMVKV